MTLMSYTDYLVSSIFGKNNYNKCNYNPYTYLTEIVVDKGPVIGDENV